MEIPDKGLKIQCNEYKDIGPVIDIFIGNKFTSIFANDLIDALRYFNLIKGQ